MKYRFRADEKAIITVRAEEEEKKRLRGMIPSIEPPEYLKRRGKFIYLNFWDLGRLANGDENTPEVAPTLTFANTSPLDFATLNNVVTYPDFDWDANNASYFAIEPDVNNWENAFYKIPFDEAYKYGIDYLQGEYLTEYYVYPVAKETDRDTVFTHSLSLGTRYKWTEQGLKVPRADRLQISCGNAFYSIATDNDWCKVTSIYDPDAPTVNFNLNKSCDIFLVPLVHLWLATSRLQLFTFPTVDKILFNYLNFIYKAWDRGVFLSAPSWWSTAYDTHPLATPFTIDNFSTAPPTTFETNFKDYYKGMDNARLYAGEDDRVTGIVSAGYIDPSNYSNTGATGTGGGSPLLETFRQQPEPNSLLAVIKKGEEFFYVWGNLPTFAHGLSVHVYTN